MTFHIGRYKDRIEQRYQIEVVTPLFMGGANPEEPELRAASIKGLLRFWWRARQGMQNISELKSQEDSFFGSTDRRSKFSIYFTETNNLKIENSIHRGKKFTTQAKGKHIQQNIIDYLGFGLCQYEKGKGNVFKRNHISPGNTFNLHIIFENSSCYDNILQAFNDLESFGGLGAKSRNGFGSIKIKNMNLNNVVPRQHNLVDYTSFSKYSQLFLFQKYESWHNALSEIGIAYREARLNLENKHNFIKRPLLAKPLIVKQEKIQIHDRHAKPYFLHVNKLENGAYQGQILFLPYNYYDTNRRDEYLATCEKVNEHLRNNCLEVL